MYNVLSRRLWFYLPILRYSTTANMAVKSYVFLDLETTGLPHLDFGATKITELTMLAVVKDHVASARNPQFPRVINKLTISLNPLKYISPDGSIVTGLTNELLDDFQPFNEETADMLITFLARLPQPTCLLAHNGERFDFPLLKSHMKSKNKEFPESVLCADTLKCFRELAVMERDDFEETKRESDEWDDDFCPTEVNQVISDAEKTEIGEREIASQPNPVTIIEKVPEVSSSQPFPGYGYKTPERPSSAASSQTPLKKVRQTDVRNERTPPKSSLTQVANETKRRLFKPSYALSSVYQHVTGKPLRNAHSSEVDCLALLEISTLLGESFHGWVSSNSKQFSLFRKS